LIRLQFVSNEMAGFNNHSTK